MTWLLKHRLTVPIATAVVVTLACSEGPTEVVRNIGAVVVSDTSRLGPGLLAIEQSAAAAAMSEVVYMSAPPGSFSDAAFAIVRNRRIDSQAQAEIFDGGFDPIGVVARAGDTLETHLVRVGGGSSEPVLNIVPANRRPKVVRTVPARNKSGVPLNTRISVVLSEPMDRALDGAVVRLADGTTLVPGQVEINALGLSLDFVPDVLLSAATTYQLVVEGIRDLDGDLLEEPLSMEFTTGTTSALAASLAILPQDMVAVASPWDFATIQAVIRDAAGTELRNVRAAWTSSDPSIVSVSDYPERGGRSAARLQGRGKKGTAVITATSGGKSASATVTLDSIGFSQVSLGANGLTCYLTPAGDAFCQGSGRAGELGGVVSSQVPVRVSSSVTFTDISASYWHACGLAVDGGAYCWGENAYGQAGAGASTLNVWEPRRVGASTFRQITTGPFHTCAVDDIGAAHCWAALQRSREARSKRAGRAC